MRNHAIDAIWSGSAEAIQAAFELTVPEAFLSLVRRVAASCSSQSEFVDFFSETCSLSFGGPECRYYSTPPELFPFGTMGVDGVHYGFVVHAPELPRLDYPVGEYCPMDSVGVILLGSNTANAFEMLFSSRLHRAATRAQVDTGKRLETLRQLAASILNVEPSASKARLRYDADGNGRALVPELPPHWRHVPTSDGVGVLAPVDAFGSSWFSPGHGLAEILKLSQQALGAGVPATALLLLREEFWKSPGEREIQLVLLERLAEVYEQLERPRLSHVCRASAKRRRQDADHHDSDASC